MRSTTFITLLSFISLSLALPSSPKARTITVQVTKSKNPLVNDEGVVDFVALEDHARRIAKRYTVDPLSKRDKTVTAQLTTVGGAHWKAEITVGTPPQTFSVQVDTGSVDLYIPHATCSTCGQHKKYDNTTSSTSSVVGRNFELPYSDGTTPKGPLFKDVVVFGGAEVRDQTFGAATQFVAEHDIDVDGVMGLSFPSSTLFGADSFIKNLALGGQIDKMMFGAKLTYRGSEITLGGVNPSLFKGEIHTSKATSSRQWKIELESVNVNGTAVVQSVDAIIDSGSNIIVGDKENVKKFYDSIPGSAPKPGYLGVAEGFYSLPCANTPELSLTFGGKAFTLPRSKFIFGNDGKGECVGSISSAFSETAGIKGAWVIGTNFMETVYTVFDMSTTPASVGFAELAQV